MKKVLVLLMVAAILLAGTVFVSAEQIEGNFQNQGVMHEILGNGAQSPCGGHGGGGGSPG
ncbi:MAG: hypothetical protein WBA22_08515 [Candidatus Methanofastidiosia archaeon]